MAKEAQTIAKQGQHENDSNDPTQSKGPNNPDKSVPITTGTPKKRKTYARRARQHERPEPQAQAACNDWNEDTRDEPDLTGSPRARDVGSGRSDSDSDVG